MVCLESLVVASITCVVRYSVWSGIFVSSTSYFEKEFCELFSLCAQFILNGMSVEWDVEGGFLKKRAKDWVMGGSCYPVYIINNGV